MARPTALLIMGGDAYHNRPEHYELLTGLLAGPAGFNVTVTDDFLSQTEASLSAYDLLVLWATHREPPPEPVNALFETVRRGIPLLGIHAAPYTVRMVEGGPQAIGSAYIKRFPHLPYQEIKVNILDREHPVTAGMEDFVTTDELYCLEDLGPEVKVLASYDGREAAHPFRLREGQPPDPRHDEANAWRLQQPRAPLVYVKQLGQGKICVNALGHDAAAISNPGFRQLIVQGAAWLIS
ncbi:MAG TPA: ThuA domain-containing protein [Chloroflexota bacterium]|nr:ThuA domain-containing protein [Chloroflexota bacterium]